MTRDRFPEHGYAWPLVIGLLIVWSLPPARANPASPPAGAFTIAVLPDTQSYLSSSQPSISAIFAVQTQWIAEHSASHNIRFVIHEGDIVDGDGMDQEQWSKARAAMDNLNARVPYAMAPGNHDYQGNAASRFTYFNDDRFFGSGSPYASQGSVGGFFEPGRTDNSYHLFRVGAADWMVVALGFGPSDEVVDWANQVVSAHPNHSAILVTHAYLYSDDTRYDWAAKGSSQRWNPHSYPIAGRQNETVNDGQQLWDKLVKAHPNFRLIFCGHVLNDGTALLTSVVDQGQVVHQMLANYQSGVEGSVNGGNGFMRLVHVSPDGTIEVQSYSPHVDESLTGPYQRFTLEISPLEEQRRPGNLSRLFAEAERLSGLIEAEGVNAEAVMWECERARLLDEECFFYTAQWIMEAKVIPVLESLGEASCLLAGARSKIDLARETGADPLVIESLEGCLARALNCMNALDVGRAAAYLEMVSNAVCWQNISAMLPIAEGIARQLEEAGDRMGLMARADYNRALTSLGECQYGDAERYLAKILGYVSEPAIPFVAAVSLFGAILRTRPCRL